MMLLSYFKRATDSDKRTRHKPTSARVQMEFRLTIRRAFVAELSWIVEGLRFQWSQSWYWVMAISRDDFTIRSHSEAASSIACSAAALTV